MQKLRSEGEEGQGKNRRQKGKGSQRTTKGGGNRREHTVAEGTWPKVDVLKKRLMEDSERSGRNPEAEE